MMWKKLITALYGASMDYYKHWSEHLRELMFALFIVLCIRSMVGVVYRIPTGSMIPTLIEGDLLVGNRFYYGLKLPFTEGVPGFRLPPVREVAAGDLIIFRAPPEQLVAELRIFYQPAEPTAQLSAAERALLGKLNHIVGNPDSPYAKRPISLRADEPDLQWLAAPTNYIFLNTGKSSVTVQLPRGLYLEYRQELSKVLDVVSVYEHRSIFTFAETQAEGVMMRVTRPLFTAASIITTAMLNSPFCLLYRMIYVSVQEGRVVGLAALSQHELSLYPHPWLALYREYVKRVIAMEGDTVELRAKRLYINGQLVPWSEAASDPSDASFTFFTEAMSYSTKTGLAGQQVFSHPVRSSDFSLEPFMTFDTELWPLATESPYAVGFRDNFGPVTVPQDHYFVMGDNRDESLDSRYIGFVPKWEVRGAPMYIFFPAERRGRIR